MTLKWGNYPGLSRQAQCNHKCPLKAEKRGRSQCQRSTYWKRRNWLLLVFTIQRHQKPRKIASFYKVKKNKGIVSPFVSTEGTQLCRFYFSSEKHINVFHFFSSVAQSCLTLCSPMNCNTPGLPVHHQLPEFTQTHVHRVGDAIKPSHPLSSPSPPAPNPSQHQSLFQWVNSLHEVAKVLEFHPQHQSSQWTPRTDLL